MAEWLVLTDFLGGDSIAGAKMKSDSEWFGGGNGTNSSGFTAFPGGFRDYEGNFMHSDGNAVFWTLTAIDKDYALFWYLYAEGNDIVWNATYKKEGLSVRCVRD
jgi:uncharacterized protein (TIGR02145 family)